MSTEQLLALEAFSSDSFLIVNKKLVSIFGPCTAIFLSNLIDKYKYYKDKHKLIDGEGFFSTFEEQAEDTNMTQYMLRKCKKELIDKGILETYMKGIPPKEIYIINFTELIEIIKEKYERNIPIKNDRNKGTKFNRNKPIKNGRNNKDTKLNNTKLNETKRTTLSSTQGKSRKRNRKKSNPPETKKSSPVNYKQILSSWNNLAADSTIPALRSISPSRQAKVRTRIESLSLVEEDWQTAFDNIKSSSFLNGDNDRGWTITFDWLVKNDENFEKVLEGNFKDKKKKSRTRKGGAKVVDGKYDNIKTIKSGTKYRQGEKYEAE